MLCAAARRTLRRCAPSAPAAASALAGAPRALRVAAAAQGEAASAPEGAGEAPARAPLRRPPPRQSAALGRSARFAPPTALDADAALPPAPASAGGASYDQAPGPPAVPPPSLPVAAMFDRHYAAPPPAPPSPLLPQQASQLCSRALEAGQTWADTQARADLMEEGKKSVLAALTEHQMNQGLSKAAAETKALCMPEYTDHVLRMTEARHKALSARITYDALKKEVDLVRTFEASRRAESQLL